MQCLVSEFASDLICGLRMLKKASIENDDTELLIGAAAIDLLHAIVNLSVYSRLKDKLYY